MLTSWIPASKNFSIEVPIGKNSVLNTTSRTIFFVKIEFDTSENLKLNHKTLRYILLYNKLWKHYQL